MCMMNMPHCKFTAEKICFHINSYTVVCGLKKQDPYVLRTIKVDALTVEKGIWQGAQALNIQELTKLPPFPQTFLPFSEATAVEQGPNTKCMRAGLPHLFNFPTITRRDYLVWCAITTKLSFKWEKSTPHRRKVERNLPIVSLWSISRPIIGTNSFVHFDLLASKLIWFHCLLNVSLEAAFYCFVSLTIDWVLLTPGWGLNGYSPSQCCVDRVKKTDVVIDSICVAPKLTL